MDTFCPIYVIPLQRISSDVALMVRTVMSDKDVYLSSTIYLNQYQTSKGAIWIHELCLLVQSIFCFMWPCSLLVWYKLFLLYCLIGVLPLYNHVAYQTINMRMRVDGVRAQLVL